MAEETKAPDGQSAASPGPGPEPSTQAQAKAAAPNPAGPASQAAPAGGAGAAPAKAAVPAKPAAAAAAAKKEAPKAVEPKPTGPLPPPPQLQTRRSFLEWGMVAWGIFFVWLAGIHHLFLRFMFPRVLYEPDPKFRAGTKIDFPELNKVYELFKESRAVWLVRLIEDGEDHLVAISTTCTHLGCTPNWLEGEQKFKCPCHGSGFYKTGVNFEGPAPRPLERYRVYIDAAGSVIVDRSVKFREDLQQWGQPESFIKMA